MKKRIITALALSLFGCQTSNLPNTQGTEEQIQIPFAYQIKGQDLQCGTEYQDLGSSKSNFQIKDARFYVSAVQLQNDQGEWVNLKLEQNIWQNKGLALLDFENKTGACEAGTEEIHTEITGLLPKGEYKALRFEVGVPFDMNHQDVISAQSPQNLSSLFWVWRSGYKFMRLDVQAEKLGYNFHLGSTGCTGTAADSQPMKMPANTVPAMDHDGHHLTSFKVADHPADGMATQKPAQCANPNRVSVAFDHYSKGQKVVFDLGALLEKSDVNVNTPDTAVGCMSAPDDPECKSIFTQLGLPFDGVEAKEQSVFSLK